MRPQTLEKRLVNTNPHPEKLRQVINRYLDDEATEADCAWLGARLEASSHDLDEFVEQLLIEADLRQHCAVIGAEPATLLRRFAKWSRNPAITSVAAALVILAAIAAILWSTIAATTKPAAEWSASPGSKVSVSGNSDHGRLQVGSEIRISQGFVEINLTAGVHCLVQAPATFLLETENRVRFSEGIAWFHVTPAARGFEVRTEGLSVVDLGTEFGVDARHRFATEVHVFEGLVEVTALSGRKETSRLSANEGIALAAAGRLEPLPPDPARFRKNLPSGLPALHFNFEDPPAPQWRATGTIALRDGVWLRSDDASSPASSPGRFGSALQLSHRRFALTNWPGIHGANPRTVAFWARIDPSSAPQNHPLIGWGDFTNTDHMADFGIRLAGDEGRIRIVSGRRWLEGDKAVADGRWHHVAVTLGGYKKGAWPEVELYIDGNRQTLTVGEPWKKNAAPPNTFHTSTNGPGARPLTIGAFVDSGKQHLPPLVGSIDELIVVEGVLTASQIHAIYENRLAEAGLLLGE